MIGILNNRIKMLEEFFGIKYLYRLCYKIDKIWFGVCIENCKCFVYMIVYYDDLCSCN